MQIKYMQPFGDYLVEFCMLCLMGSLEMYRYEYSICVAIGIDVMNKHQHMMNIVW